MRERILTLLKSSGLAQDALCDCARVTMTGRSCVTVEGQHGVIELGKERIRLNTGNGVLLVMGQGLTLSILTEQQAIIRAEMIDTVSYRSVHADGRGEAQRDL